jgi:iron complex transport system permease protein
MWLRNVSTASTGVRALGWSGGLGALLAVTMVLAATVGSVPVGPVVAGKVMLNAVAVPTDAGWVHPFSFAVARTDQTIVSRLRLPRIALGAVVGFALGTAGTVMQGFFRNPMADPSIIGVSTGAAVGAVAVIVFPLAVPFSLQLAAFTGALVAGFAVYLIASEGGRTPVATLLLAGVAVQTLLGAMVSFMLLHAGDSLERAVYWLMGHLHTASWSKVGLVAVVAVPGFVVLAAYTRDLNALLLGETDAHTLGVDVRRTRMVLLATASVVTAAAVAVAGVIGFVGLVVPHVMRLLVGPDHRVLLPTSALAGATFLVLTDTAARMGPSELPVGIVTAALGAPFFLYLLRDREVHEL